MQQVVRIGGAGGFWGDSTAGAEQILRSADVDYLVFDYLAELTMSILAKARQRHPDLGYATDFVADVMAPLLPEIKARKIRILTNAGGMNPRGCAAALRKAAAAQGLSLRIAVVEGDDLLPHEASLRAQGVTEMFTGADLPPKLTSMNAYLGAFPIAAALAQGADVVITGRCVDSALALGALIHEFGWSAQDYDRLAAGSVVGHILECGTQTTGGLYTDWTEVPGRHDIGYPIAECSPDGSFILTKPRDTGGLVTPTVVTEQLLYEIGDPGNYLLPDVTCDFRGITIEAAGENRVRISGARGAAPTRSYKVSAVYEDGYRSGTTLTLVGRDAAAKAAHVADAIIARTREMFRRRNLGDYEEICIEPLGTEQAFYGAHARGSATREVVLRIAVRHAQAEALDLFGREIAPFGTAGTPGTTGFSGRPKPGKVFRLFSFLVPKDQLDVTVELEGTSTAIPALLPPPGEPDLPPVPATAPASLPSGTRRAPLSAIAVARSGDKGDLANIAVIARSPELYGCLLREVTPERVAEQLSHLVKGKVERFEVPGVHAVNLLLHEALGGGGSASLRNDPLGKAFAQILLDMEITIPA
ncbi:hypothetical protein FHS85_000912 [Rhodoligotrophos appendicifer]|uniref:acyclic terpene utilization AtuA family protein n=1 Tax=Rhodoligotrophos appendicifer TaxID=987056 RepID=UPI00117C149C|nr:acyclic terpene utilization AtuA family protein [Rhodoligotrophos appendicifer]